MSNLNLNKNKEFTNLGGISPIYFIPISEISSLDDIIKGVINKINYNDAEFIPYYIDIIQEKGKFKEDQVSRTRFNYKISVKYSKDELSTRNTLEKIDSKKLVVLVPDANGNYRVIGSKENPVFISSELDKGTSTSDLNAYDLIINWSTKYRAPFIAVSDDFIPSDKNCSTPPSLLPQKLDWFKDTIADIRIMKTHYHGDDIGCYANRYIYQYNSTSTDADNGTTILKPDDVLGSGRWVKYLKIGTDEYVTVGVDGDYPANDSIDGLWQALDDENVKIILVSDISVFRNININAHITIYLNNYTLNMGDYDFTRTSGSLNIYKGKIDFAFASAKALFHNTFTDNLQVIVEYVEFSNNSTISNCSVSYNNGTFKNCILNVKSNSGGFGTSAFAGIIDTLTINGTGSAQDVIESNNTAILNDIYFTGSFGYNLLRCYKGNNFKFNTTTDLILNIDYIYNSENLTTKALKIFGIECIDVVGITQVKAKSSTTIYKLVGGSTLGTLYLSPEPTFGYTIIIERVTINGNLETKVVYTDNILTKASNCIVTGDINILQADVGSEFVANIVGGDITNKNKGITIIRNILNNGTISIESTAEKTNVQGNRTLTVITDAGVDTYNLPDNYLI